MSVNFGKCTFPITFLIHSKLRVFYGSSIMCDSFTNDNIVSILKNTRRMSER